LQQIPHDARSLPTRLSGRTNKCLARNSKSRARAKATKEHEKGEAYCWQPTLLLAAFRSVNFVNVTTTAMKTRLALALLAAIVSAVNASGAANRSTPWGEQRSRQPYGPGPVPPGFHAPLPATPGACSRCPASALRLTWGRLYAAALTLPAPLGQLNAVADPWNAVR
jgi:hypothetical protein